MVLGFDYTSNLVDLLLSPHGSSPLYQSLVPRQYQDQSVQDRMAELLTSILGDLLYKQENNLTTLPSPETLKGKILIKAKKASPTIEEDDGDGDGANQSSKDFSQKLSDLGTGGTKKTKKHNLIFFSKSPGCPL